MDTYRVIGLMSGTSLDGLDVAFCELKNDAVKWTTKVLQAETVKYSQYWLDALSNAHRQSSEKLFQLHTEYGKYLGSQVMGFIENNDLGRVDLVASHGHTIFHQPDKGFTFQLGDGAALAVACGVKTVCDFRTTDVALGGQGAPLVPMGDQLLFSEYDYCLNLGGFANISYSKDEVRFAYDICPANIILNNLAKQAGMEFDKDGELARSGRVDTDLLDKLESIEFFSLKPPKSLGREWLEQEYLPLLIASNSSVPDKLRTVCENIALRVSEAVEASPSGKILITGGGAFNVFLMELLRNKTQIGCIIPESGLVNFKEALVFALLGVLRLRGETNCLASVTGAERDSVGGSVYLP